MREKNVDKPMCNKTLHPNKSKDLSIPNSRLFGY